MKGGKLSSLILVLCALSTFAFYSAAFAQPTGLTADEAMAIAATPAPAPAMDEDLMARIKDYAAVNDNHKALEMFAGNWLATTAVWTSPTSQPIVSKNQVSSMMIFGGRFLQQSFAGVFMDGPYEGAGIMGYDNIKKMYQCIWLDNTGTGIVKIDAQYDPQTKTFFEQGNVSCPITGGQRWLRGKITFLNNDNYVQEFYMKDPSDLVNGTEFKSMEIVFSRAK